MTIGPSIGSIIGQSDLVTRLSSPGGGSAAAPTDKEKIRKAASQFEALFLSQMMKSAREASAGDTSGDQSGQSMMEIAEEHMAQALAEHGGLGLAKSVVTSFGNLATKHVAAPGAAIGASADAATAPK